MPNVYFIDDWEMEMALFFKIAYIFSLIYVVVIIVTQCTVTLFILNI